MSATETARAESQVFLPPRPAGTADLNAGIPALPGAKKPVPAVGAKTSALHDFARVMTPARPLTPPRIALKQDDVKNGLGKLVLTIVELLRELLERQAIRRMEAGSLTEAEVERLGATFIQLGEEVKRLKREFGLEDEDLNIDLGPLGKLL